MLRVGIMLTQSISRNWAAALISGIRQSSFASVTAVVQLPPAQISAPSLFSWHRWSRVLFDRYEQWDHARHASAKSALAPVDTASLLAGIPVLPLPADAGNAAEIQAIQALNLDLLLCLDVAGRRNLFQETTRYGTWLLDIADTLENPEEPPVWREHSLAADDVLSRLLHFPSTGNTPRLLYQTRTAVDPSSLAQSRNPIYWKTAAIIQRCMASLDSGGQPYLDALPAAEVVRESSRTSSGGDLGMRRFLRREVSRRLQVRSKSSQRATFAKWCVGLRQRKASLPFDSPETYRLIASPRDRFFADPFLFEHEGQTWLFFEDFRYPEGKAVISCCHLNEAGEPDEPFEVLRLPYHLSYPFIFQENGIIYMIPESRGNRTVSLFRATRFPDVWQHEIDLFSDVDMVDATLHHAEDGTWWMFAGVSDGKYSNSDELCLYFADSFRGPWTPHPQNPLISDVRRARPAGRIFREGARLIRPSQDCGPAYGYGLVFSEIEELTRTSYRERPVSKLLPESIPGNRANHTYNRTAHFEAIDRFFIESQLSKTDTFSVPPSIP